MFSLQNQYCFWLGHIPIPGLDEADHRQSADFLEVCAGVLLYRALY